MTSNLVRYQCPACERDYEKEEYARQCNCGSLIRTIWECSKCGGWWNTKNKKECCGISLDLSANKGQ